MIEVTKDGDKTIIIPSKNIVAVDADDMKSAVKIVLDKEPDAVAMDMKNVSMIDSMGIGVLIAIHNTLKKRGLSLELFNMTDNINHLLRTMRLHQHLILK